MILKNAITIGGVMKIRQGFVSNSSSSSFIIAFKGDAKQLKARLDEVFKLPDTYPLKESVGDVSKTIINCIDSEYDSGIKSMDDFLSYQSDEYGNDIEDIDKEQMDLIQKGFTLFPGSFSSEEWGIEATLCETEINFISDDLIIKAEGGY
jgi:hypothetical protein